MKPHGKGKISSGQSIHIYLRISRNLEDEIFPKGVGVVTPKFLFGFFKRFYLTWGEWFKFFFKRTLPLIYFSLWQKFCLDSPKTCFWSWRFLLLLWTQDKILFTWEKWLLKISWKCTMAFGIILCHFQQFLLAMALVQILSPNPSLTFGSWFVSNPASWTSPCDYFYLNLIQTNFCLLF